MALKDIVAAASGAKPSGRVQSIVQQLKSSLVNSGSTNMAFTKKAGAGYALGLEEFAEDGAAQAQVTGALQDLRGLLAGLEGIGELSAAQKEAAMYAAAISGDIGGFLRTSNASGADGAIAAVGGIGRIAPALESFDEKENKAAAVYTVAYNLVAARQDAFGEAFFPTVVVPPDQQGYHVHINLVNLIDSTARKATGELNDWGRVNLVNVVRNPDLIHNDSTKIVPVYRDAYKQFFVDAAVLAPRTETVNREDVTTSFLAVGKKFDLIDLSQTDTQIEAGYMNETDSVDTDIRVKRIAVKIGADVVILSTANIPGNQFHHNVQGDNQEMIVRIQTDALNINANTKRPDGSALVDLAPVVNGQYVVQLDVMLNGSVFRDKGQTRMSADPVLVAKVVDKDGVVHTPTSAAVASIVALFDGAQVIGYELDARRTNLNRRSIGQMLETRQETQVYAVPLLSPFTVKRPLGMEDTTDASDLASLITLTHASASGAAVNKLFQAASDLRELVSGVRPVGDNLMVMGISRKLITAHYEHQTLKVESLVQTRNSAELAANIQAAMINLIRDMVFRAYQVSGWKAAADLLAGGESQKPRVIIGTDQTLARYLQLTGDLRLIGGGFDDVQIVDTLNDKMKGKIFIAFGVKDAVDGQPHPLQFGNMAFKPEVTVVLPIHRGGANTKELTVQPSFVHVVNTAVLMEIDVTGIPETVETRVPVKVEGTIITP